MSVDSGMNNDSGLDKNAKIAPLSGNLMQKLSSLFASKPVGPNDLVGLDIGPERIKLLKINTSTTPFQVIDYATAPLPAGVIVKDEIKNAAVIGGVLKDMLKRFGVTAKFAAVAIPRTLAIIKNITVDKRFSADDIESRAWIEANRLFPDLVGNIYLDFTITGPSLTVPDQLDLLLVACRKEHIKPYLEVVNLGGLTPKFVDVNCYALERALQLITVDQPNLETIALLNVNASQSSLLVLHKKQLIHAHDQTYDGQRLTKQVDDYIKTKHAEPGMENVPIVVDDVSYRALLQENFLSHLRHVMHFFYSSRSNISIERIYLSGDCATIPDFAVFIEKEIGITTVLADPFTHMTIHSSIHSDDLVKLASTLMTCSGLALSGGGNSA